jgi:hypothetical protein
MYPEAAWLPRNGGMGQTSVIWLSYCHPTRARLLRLHTSAGHQARRCAPKPSHLLFSDPSRALRNCGSLAVDGQLAALQSIAEMPSVPAVIKNITAMIGRHENTRVVMALAQAGDEEPSLRTLQYGASYLDFSPLLSWSRFLEQSERHDSRDETLEIISGAKSALARFTSFLTKALA